MKHFLFFIFAVAALFAIILFIAPCNKNGFFEIKQGENLFQIAENLRDQGFIQSKFLFCSYVFLKDRAKNLRYGVYEFSNKDTFADIAEKIIQGKTKTIKVTIPEGFNVQQISHRISLEFENQNLNSAIDATQIQNQNIESYKNEYEFLSNCPDNAFLEGFLFPDTYHFSPLADNEQVIRVFLDNFDKKLNQKLREDIKKQGKTIFEIIVMASLLEKEVADFEDKRKVSGILWKRLEIGMPLQVDATIIYITGKKSSKVSIAETKIDSPYNTYKYRGLPKGPICSPGKCWEHGLLVKIKMVNISKKEQ